LVKVVDPAPPQPPAPEAVTPAIERLANAQRPLAILGKGAAYARADEEIRSFLETTGIPFLPMSMAKGLLPDDHPQSAAAARSYAIGNADVVMVVGARLNWLLSHGRPPLWSEATRFVQVDISPTEIDSNRAIAAPVIGDIKSVFAAFNAALKPGQIERQAAWTDEIGKRKQQNVERMAARLNADPSPMNFSSALRAVRSAARRALRQDHRGVRRRRLPLRGHAEPHQGVERSARLRQAGVDQRCHRPDGGHRKRSHPEPQPAERCRPEDIERSAALK